MPLSIDNDRSTGASHLLTRARVQSRVHQSAVCFPHIFFIALRVTFALVGAAKIDPRTTGIHWRIRSSFSPVDGYHYRATHHDSRAALPWPLISQLSFFTLHPSHQQHAYTPKEDPPLSLEHSMNPFHCASQIFGKAILLRGWGNMRTCR